MSKSLYANIVVDMTVKYLGLIFINQDEMPRHRSIKRFLIDDELLLFLQGHRFEKQTVTKYGDILVDKKMQEESGSVATIKDYSWILSPHNIPRKNQPYIELGFNFKFNLENPCVAIYPQINGLYDVAEFESSHLRLFNVLVDYHNDPPLLTQKMIKEFKSSGRFAVNFEELGIQGYGIILK